jgi:hypothetical protein
MNKRITEKVYKRKFQRVFAQIMSGILDRPVKASRVRLSVFEMDREAMWMVGHAGGTEMRLRIFPDSAKKIEEK